MRRVPVVLGVLPPVVLGVRRLVFGGQGEACLLFLFKTNEGWEGVDAPLCT